MVVPLATPHVINWGARAVPAEDNGYFDSKAFTKYVNGMERYFPTRPLHSLGYTRMTPPSGSISGMSKFRWYCRKSLPPASDVAQLHGAPRLIRSLANKTITHHKVAVCVSCTLDKQDIQAAAHAEQLRILPLTPYQATPTPRTVVLFGVQDYSAFRVHLCDQFLFGLVLTSLPCVAYSAFPINLPGAFHEDQ